MKKFLLKSLAFSLPLLLILFLIEKGLATIENSYTQQKKCIDQNVSSVELLVFGSSESKYDILPSILNKNSCSLANSNQDLYFDKELLFKYKDKTPRLKMIILPISYFSLEYNLNNSEEYWRKFFYYRYFGIKSPENNLADIRNYSLIALYTPENAIGYILKGFKINLAVENMKGNIPFGGKENAQRHSGYMRDSLFDINTQYLNTIVDILKKRGVTVVLVTLPVSSEYSKYIDGLKYKRMLAEVEKISAVKGVLYLNYFQDDRFSLEDFIDGADHLTKQASERFSQMLKLDINK